MNNKAIRLLAVLSAAAMASAMSISASAKNFYGSPDITEDNTTVSPNTVHSNKPYVNINIDK